MNPIQKLSTFAGQIKNEGIRKFIGSHLNESSAKVKLNSEEKELKEPLIKRQFESIKKKHLSIPLQDMGHLSTNGKSKAEKIVQSTKNVLDSNGQNYQKDLPLENDLKFLKLITDQIDKKKYQDAYENLKLLRFDFSLDVQVIQGLYAILHNLLPHLDAIKLEQLDLLQNLLKSTFGYSKEQMQLAIDLGDWHHLYSFELPLEKKMEAIAAAMHCYAKAIKIAEIYHLQGVNEIHQAASSLYIQAICMHLDSNDFEQKLDLARQKGDQEQFRKTFDQIKRLQNYCFNEKTCEVIQNYFKRARNVYNQFKPNQQDLKDLAPDIRQGLKTVEIPKEYITKKYRQGLIKYRKKFEDKFEELSREIGDLAELSLESGDIENIKKFQKKMTGSLRSFFKDTILFDSFEILNLSERDYDMCVLGSVAREEPCPYSDIEWKMLIQNEEDLKEFQLFAKLFELQLISLGESNLKHLPLFSAIEKKKQTLGMRVDGNPADMELIQTPRNMAACQHVLSLELDSPANITLTSCSLQSNNNTLYTQYQKEIKKCLSPGKMRERALERMRERLRDFKKRWPKSLEELHTLDLKSQFVELINHVIGDFRLYFGIETVNTLEVIEHLTEGNIFKKVSSEGIEELIERKVFKKESGRLLQEAVAAIYMIRVRVHFIYKEQKEKISLRNSSDNRSSAFLDEKEMKAVTNAYWLVLVPFYAYLDQVLTNQQKALADYPPIDFYEILLEQILKAYSGNENAISTFVTSLVDKKASIETHFHFYAKISNKDSLEHLRQSYIRILKESPGNNEVTLKKLSHHPNNFGFRQIETEMKNGFEELLRKAASDIEQKGKYGFSVIIEGPFLKQAYLKQEVINTILDANGNINKEYHNCVNRVAFLSSTFCGCYLHFKQQPQNSSQYSFHPGREQAVSRLMMRLFGHGVSVSELVKFTVRQPKKNPRSYLVLVSMTVTGKNLTEVASKDLEKLDKKRLSELFLSVPLILPGDLREANFIYTKGLNENNQEIFQAVSIDNDVSFIKAMTRQILTDRFNIHLYNVLFLKFPDMVLDPQAIEDFLTLQPSLLLEAWLRDLTNWNENIHANFSEFEKLSDGFSPLCLFEKGTGTQLITQFFRLQAFLKKNKHRPIQVAEVLKTIVSVENDEIIDEGTILYQEYTNAKSLSGSASNKTRMLTGRYGNRSLSMSESQAVMYKNIPANEKEKKFYLPDIALKEIKKLILLHFQGFFFLQNHESAILEKGFEEFAKEEDPEVKKTVLHGLLIHKYGKLNLSYSSELTNAILIKFLERSAGLLKHLDIRHCSQITDECLVAIEKHCPNLEEFFISHCEKIERFEVVPFLRLGKGTPLNYPALKILHISELPKLWTIRIKTPLLETLKGDHNPMLKKAKIESQVLTNPNFNSSPQVKYEVIKKSEVIRKKLSSPIQGVKNARVSLDIKKPVQPNSVQAKPLQQVQQLIPFEENIPALKLNAIFENRRLFVAGNETDFLIKPVEIQKAFLHDHTENHFEKSIESILFYIRLAQQTIDKVHGKHAISIIGNTGSGKSTTVNYLLGCKMVENQPENGEIESTIRAINPVAIISHSLESETLIPAGYALTIGNNHNNEMILCDMPGFLETRGPEINIANAVNTRNFLAKARTNRILFLINYYSLIGDRAEGLKTAIRILTKFFSSVDLLNQNMASVIIGVTRVPSLISFDNVKTVIQRVAQSEKWDLKNHLEKMIPIDPIERPNALTREVIIDLLTQLPPIEETNELYTTALNTEDLQLLAKISKHISKKVQAYSQEGNVEGILQEYHRLYSLMSIQHPAIEEALHDLREKIQSDVHELISQVRANASSDVPEKRRMTKQKMAQIEPLGKLDLCFSPELGRISFLVQKIKNEVKEAEKTLQESTNSHIQDDFDLLIPKLSFVLEKLRDHQRSRLANIDKTQNIRLHSLKQFNQDVVDNLLFLFDQVDQETRLRPNKYYFGDLAPLEKVKEQRELEINDLILSMYKQARIAEISHQFSSAYQELLLQIPQVSEEHIQFLSQDLLNIKDVLLLSQHGFPLAAIEQIIFTLQELHPLVTDMHPYEVMVNEFLQKVHAEAIERQKQKKIQSLCQSIKNLITTPELDENMLNLLNQQYLDLALLDNKYFEELSQLALKTLVELPERDIHRYLTHIDNDYHRNMTAAFKKMATLHSLKACSRHFASCIAKKEGLEKIVEKQEVQRRKEEIHRYSIELSQLLVAAQAAKKTFTIKNPACVSNLSLNCGDVNESLNKLKNHVDIASFCTQRKGLVEAIQTQGQCYFYPQDAHLKTTLEQLEPQLSGIFAFISQLAPALELQQNMENLLNMLQQEASHIMKKNALGIIQNRISIDAGFSQKNVEKFHEYQKKCEQVPQPPASQEIADIYSNIHESIKICIEKIDCEARQKNMETIVNRLRVASLNREFLNILEDIPLMLSTLQHESPDSYESAIQDLTTAINAWQNSIELENFLVGESYSNIANTYIVLEKIQNKLRAFREIDTSKFIETITFHLSQLFKQAMQEISCTLVSDTFFELNKVKKILDVFKIFKQHQIEFKINEKALLAEAEKIWQELIQGASRISSVSNNNNTLSDCLPLEDLSRLAKQMIKQYALATELSQLVNFKKMIRGILKTIPTDALIYNLGLQVAEFINHPSSSVSSAANGIIETFPEFERINIKLFNERAGGINFELALKELRCSPEPSVNSHTILKQTYEIFYTTYSSIVEQIIKLKKDFNNDELIAKTKKLAKTLAPHAISLNTHPKKTALLLAYIFAEWTFQNSKKGYFSGEKDTLLQPHSTQVLSILRLIAVDDPEGIKNHLVQIKTGEGKSISLGIISTLFALLGYSVTVACYSSYLSGRDGHAFAGLREVYGVDVSGRITYSTIKGLVYKLLGTSLPDFYSNIPTFLGGKVVSHFKSLQIQKRLLLLDEVDVFFGPSFYGDVFLPRAEIKSKDSESLLRYMWKHKERFNNSTFKNSVEEIMLLSCVKSLLKEYPNLQLHLPTQIKKMMLSLKYFPEDGSINHACIVKDDQVGYVHKWNLDFDTTKSYVTAFSYLYYHERGDIKSDKYLLNHLTIGIIAANILYSELPNFFSLKLGLTATLEDLSEEENQILDSYAFTKRSYIPSTFIKKALKEEDTLIIGGEKKGYFEAIKNEIDSKLKNNRACLVVLKNIKQLHEFNDYFTKLQRLASHFTQPELLTDDLKDEDKASIIARATSQFKITLMTRQFGRGIDFICRDTGLIQNGGMHVILTFYPKTLSEEIQIKGRTCRQDDPGSIRKILFADDLLEKGLIPSKTSENGQTIPDLYEIQASENCDAYLAEQRKGKYAVIFEKMQRNFERNKEKHQLSLALAEKIEARQIAEANELLMKFN